MNFSPRLFPFGSASAQAAALRAGRLRSADLLRAYLDRVDRFNPALNAVVVDDREAALKRARAAGRALAKGERRGPLQLFRAGLATASFLPATIAPGGLTAEGLPVGAQIVGPEMGDRTTIGLAAQLARLIGGFVPPPGY